MKFKTEDIVSSVTGILAGDMEGIYTVLSYMTGESIFTHQIPAAADAVKDEISSQCPWINDVDFSGLTVETYKEWLENLHSKFGVEHDLVSCPNLWGTHNPIEDLEKIISPDQKMIILEV